MRISVFKLNEVELSIVRQCSGDCVVVPYSRFEDVVQTDESQLFIINAGLSGYSRHDIEEQIFSNESFQKNQIILLIDDSEIEINFPSDTWSNIDFYRKPIIENSLRARISFHSELMRARTCAREKDEQATLFDAILSQSPVGIMLTHDEVAAAESSLEHFTINPMVEEIMGRSKEEIKRLSLADVTHPDDLQPDLDNLYKLIAGEIDGYAMDKRYIRPEWFNHMGPYPWLPPYPYQVRRDLYRYIICTTFPNERSWNPHSPKVNAANQSSCPIFPEWRTAVTMIMIGRCALFQLGVMNSRDIFLRS